MSDMERVRYERVGGVAVLRFDDGKVNTFHGESVAEWDRALDRAESDKEAGAIVFAGRPGYFSAGLDLKRLPGLSADELRAFIAAYGRLMLRLFAFPKPTVAVATGHALAGGCVMLCAGDKRVAGDGPWKIGLNEVSIGIFLPTFAIEMARHCLHSTAVTDALCCGRTYDPSGALMAGYLDDVVPAEDAISRGVAFASEMAALPARAFRLTKLGVKAGALRRAEETMESEIGDFLAGGVLG